MTKDLGYWLAPYEQIEACGVLWRHNLIRRDNNRGLLLSHGGTTDIYLQLRDIRDSPEALRYFTKKYASPLRRLGADRFVEVPDGVSPLAGPLAAETGIPYLTVRKEGKAGRVTKGKIIGHANPGDRVCILDDAVTSGSSIGYPWQECINVGMDLEFLPAIALLDRQAGWQGYFAEQGIEMDIWFGMDLHFLRAWLIRGGHMQRCDPAVEEKNPIIVALDGKTWAGTLAIIDLMRTTGCILKVNDLLFHMGMQLIPELEVYGEVLADLKINDIPNTAKNIAERLLEHPPWGLTVHATAGYAMMKMVVDVLAAVKTKVFAVTVLTSIDPQTCEEIYQRLPLDQVMVLAAVANKAGVDGFVCSAEEAEALRKVYPNAIIVTPGVRSLTADIRQDDQKRKKTPAEALVHANKVVMGRQVLQAEDPIAEVKRVCEEELRLGIF